LPGDKQPIRVEVDRLRLDGDVSCWLEGLPEGIKTERLLLPAGKSAGTIDVAIPSDAVPRTVTPPSKRSARMSRRAGRSKSRSTRRLPNGVSCPFAPRTMKAGEIITVLAHIERKKLRGPRR